MPGTVRKSRVLAIALATGTAVASVMTGIAPAQAQAAKKGSAPAGFSKEFIAVAAPVQQKLDAASQAKADPAGLQAALAGVPAMVAQAEAAAKTPRDKMAAGQFVMQLGALTNDPAMVQRGGQAMLASGQLDAQQTAQIRGMLQGLGGDAIAQKVEAQIKANNPRGALAELRTAVANQPAGQPAPASWFARATQIAVTSNIADEALYWSARQAEVYPNSRNWLAATQTVKQFGALDPQEKLDLFRLMSRSGALNNEPRFVASEYMEYADMANLRGFYGEAVRVVDQGRSAGALTGTQGAQLRSAANAKVASDRASLPGQERDARAAPTGVPALATADVYLSFGEPAKAEELYKLALEKGGVDRDRALTRLGIAQFDQGKYAAAQDNFSKVTAQRRLPIARLWLTLIGQKDPSAVPRRAS